jgi:hypothetical protein
MLEHENVKGVVESLKIMTEWNTERLCRLIQSGWPGVDVMVTIFCDF